MGDAAESPLFAGHDTLEIGFELDLDVLEKIFDIDDVGDVPGVITVVADDGSSRRLDVVFRPRGRWNPVTSNCDVPAMFILFDAAQVTGTVFEGQTMLPFTSHCERRKRQYHMYALLEFIAYRIYNELTDASLRVRLARIEYTEPGSSRPYHRYGFFVEHFDDAAHRLDARVFKIDTLDPRLTDPTDLATLSVFQYMISNLDFSVIKQHNVVLMRRTDGRVLAVPFDFDYSGLVNAEYAAHPYWARTRNVRQRVYRGYCRPDIDWLRLFEHFIDNRPAIDALVYDVEGLTPRSRRDAKYFLRGFWKIVETPKKRNRSIVERCRRMPAPQVDGADR